MLLRDERQIALSEVETMCIEAADGYASAAARADDAALKEVFAELGREHSRFAAELAPQIRALDDLPKTPDPDREAVEQALTAVHAFFSSDARDTLLTDREQCERKVEEVVREALGHPLPPAAKTLLRDMLAHAGKARDRLLSMRPA